MIAQTRYIIILLSTCLFLTGCVSLLDAATDGPINTDPGKRSVGTYIDDSQLRTIVKVNIKKAVGALTNTHINIYVFNQVVLLTGEVPTPEIKHKVETATATVNRVRQVHNELSIQAPLTFTTRIKDNWLKNKIRAKLAINQNIDSDRVKVITENGTVYLMGLLTSEQSKIITDVVRRVSGVKKVVRAIEYIEPH